MFGTCDNTKSCVDHTTRTRTHFAINILCCLVYCWHWFLIISLRLKRYISYSSCIGSYHNLEWSSSEEDELVQHIIDVALHHFLLMFYVNEWKWVGYVDVFSISRSCCHSSSIGVATKDKEYRQLNGTIRLPSRVKPSLNILSCTLHFDAKLHMFH